MFDAPLNQVQLTDRYRKSDGYAVMTGMQALVRLMIEQYELDRRNGLKTGIYISGYRGSPVGAFDTAIYRAKEDLKDRDIVFQPGLNEDLAMTAIGGTQMVPILDSARRAEAERYDGVVGVWYGKGPGVDRSIDAVRHCSHQGSSPKGGMLMIAGDDASGKSSSLAHQSEQSLIAGMVPILFPASIHEYIPLGLHAIAMSRYAGCVASLKVVVDTADATATVDLENLVPEIKLPEPPQTDLHAKPGFTPFLEAERIIIQERLPAAVEYARVNRLNRVTIQPRQKKLGIVAVGRAYLDVCEALRALRIPPDASGIGVFKVAMVWPMEPRSFLSFAQGYEEIIIVEDKKELFETLAAKALLDLPNELRPRLIGKVMPDGARILPSFGELSPALVEQALSARCKAVGIMVPGKRKAEVPGEPLSPFKQRIPWYCSGCPHNSSTKLPEGSTAASGIGCHTISALMDAENHSWCNQMGGEGAAWMGRAPFADKAHIFQNIGDGTYDHSGYLAIRAAIASGVNITYKLLYNDAVALTGGQTLDTGAKPWDIAAQMLAEGASQVVVVTDNVEDLLGQGMFPRGVEVRHRKLMDQTQRELREVKGTSVLIYVQTCAAEKRRRRKRKAFPNPPKRMMIASRVCEGCGDCGIKSNCVAVKPLETDFGTKRIIDQTACNKDYSCQNGFCPSFITVAGDTEPLKGSDKGLTPPPSIASLPEVTYGTEGRIALTGIGGTGVVTVGAVLGMAAHLMGRHSLTLDQTGLSQKNGAVTNHLQIGLNPLDDRPARLPDGTVDTLIACDLLTGAGQATLSSLKPKVRVFANTNVEPLAAFAKDPNQRPDAQTLIGDIQRWAAKALIVEQPVSDLALALLGDGMGTNFMVVGMAYQAGCLPLSAEAIEAAIHLNAVAADMNIAAFNWGRWLQADPELVHQAAAIPQPKEKTLDEQIDFFAAELSAYQNDDYAADYCEALLGLEKTEIEPSLLSDVALQLYRVMAYKDEYEVARLLTHPDTKADLERQFKAGSKVSLNLAPPLMAQVDPITGEPAKQEFGPWILPLLSGLKHLKTLRGSRWDVFGYTQERKLERGLRDRYLRLVQACASGSAPVTTLEQATNLLAQIKGFGPVKLRNFKTAQSGLALAFDPVGGLPKELNI